MHKIAGVLLAAGASTRFGQPKQLVDWWGRPLVVHIAETALAAGLSPLVVVIGHQAERVQAAVADLPLQTAMNWRWEEGLSTSVQAGLAALPPDVEGAIFLQCDQPLITADILRQLVARFAETGAPVVHPGTQEQRTPPALFARALFPQLAALSGDQGGRAVIARYSDQAATVAVEDPDRLADMDTPEDYERLRRQASARSQSRDLRSIRHLVIDMDGVLWRGDQPISAILTFFPFMHQHDIRYVLATNNASKRPEQYREKLASFGVDVPLGSILTSAQATAAYLAAREPAGAPLYVIGGEGLRQALEARGFVLTEEGAQHVVVGWDPELNWWKLARAALLIRRGAGFIGTNPDLTYPTAEGLVPGNGATLAALQASTGVAPLVIGKPEPWLYHAAMERMGAQPENTAIIGDRLETDIAGGARLGLFTILVLSGVTSAAQLASSPLKPDLVCTDVAELARRWTETATQEVQPYR